MDDWFPQKKKTYLLDDWVIGVVDDGKMSPEARQYLIRLGWEPPKPARKTHEQWQDHLDAWLRHVDPAPTSEGLLAWLQW